MIGRHLLATNIVWIGLNASINNMCKGREPNQIKENEHQRFFDRQIYGHVISNFFHSI